MPSINGLAETASLVGDPTRAAPPFLTWIVLFLLIVAALTGIEWHMLHHVNHEVGDFAANRCAQSAWL